MASHVQLQDWHYIEAIQRMLLTIAHVIDKGTIDDMVSFMYTKNHLSDIMLQMINETQYTIKKLYRLFKDMEECTDKGKMFEDMGYCIEFKLLRPDLKDKLYAILDKLQKLPAEANIESFTEEVFIKLAREGPFTTLNEDTRIDGSSQYTSLMKAVVAENDQSVAHILTENEEMLNEITHTTKTTALILACRRKNFEIIKLLIKHPNIDGNMKDIKGLSALMHALLVGNVDAVNILIKSEKIQVSEHNEKNHIRGICYAWGHEPLVNMLATIISENYEHRAEHKIRVLKQYREQLEGFKNIIIKKQIVETFSAIAHFVREKINSLEEQLKGWSVDYNIELSLPSVIETATIMGSTEVLNIYLPFIDPEKLPFLYTVIDYLLALSIVMDNMATYNCLQQYMVCEDEVGKLVACYNDSETSKNAMKLLKLSEPLTKVLYFQRIGPHNVIDLFDVFPISIHDVLEQKDSAGNTVFMLLCSCCDPIVVSSISKKINKQILNSQNKSGKTAFMLSCSNKQKETPKLLAKMTDFIVNKKDYYGKTNLMYAVRYDINLSTSKTTKLLIDMGADVNAVDAWGYTVLEYATRKNHHNDIANMLIENGAVVNLVNKYGKNADWRPRHFPYPFSYSSTISYSIRFSQNPLLNVTIKPQYT